MALKKMGYRISIASYGHKHVILSLLHSLAPGMFTAHNVITPQDLGGQDGTRHTAWGKDKMLSLLAKRYQCLSYNMTLFDDSIANVLAVRRAGYFGIHVRNDENGRRNNLVALVRHKYKF